ncbi:MAG: translation initiation factor IF-2 [Candidatus Peribacteraceae bacterium]|nr:translation initiation factor IF-2 [Candidatus Peribacteraceae bacterium]
MRLVKVAKALGMTGQQLRHELESVDFGVKATDREIPDGLAQGIIRFIARKHGIEVDMESLGFSDDGQRGEAPVGREAVASEAKEEVKADRPEEESVSSEGLKVLRKLTLEDVPQAAIAEEKRKLDQGTPSGKKEREEARQEERAAARTLQQKKAETAMQQQIKHKEGKISLPDQLTVKEFAEKAGIQIPQVIQALMKNGVMATINQTIDFDTAAIVAAELGVDVEREESKVDVEHLMSRNIEELLKDEKAHLQPRPPVVVVMGHVDHGKTSILDAVRETNVASGEAGGITQHIGAYQVVHTSKGEKEGHRITFLDTPGHEAFTAMRARGAKVTDIAIIVVAAEEGVKPTTVEAINHAKEAGVPIIVAMNKMDKEGADPERVKGELAAQGLQPEEWGGSVPVVPCSAKTKKGIDDLLDHIVLISELQGFSANPDRSAVATVIESHLDASLGALATVIVNTGTLHKGDAFICGRAYGKVRAMINAQGERLESVTPSGAARVSGFGDVPAVGDIVQVVASEQHARGMVEEVRRISASRQKRSFADLVSRLSEGKLTQLKLVLKADTQGSLEALQDALRKLASDEVTVKVIHAAVGTVSENDIMMAAASDGVVIGFHVTVPVAVHQTAEREGVEVREYDVVYTLLDDVQGLLKGLVEPVEEEKIYGHLEVKGVFLTKRSEQIIGGKVTDGVLKRLPFRLLREGKEVGTGRITSLRKAEKDIKEAKEGSECGMRVETSVPVQEGDVLEVYLRELKKKA